MPPERIGLTPVHGTSGEAQYLDGKRDTVLDRFVNHGVCQVADVLN